MLAVMSSIVKKFYGGKMYRKNDQRSSLQASCRRGRADRAETSGVAA